MNGISLYLFFLILWICWMGTMAGAYWAGRDSMRHRPPTPGPTKPEPGVFLELMEGSLSGYLEDHRN